MTTAKQRRDMAQVAARLRDDLDEVFPPRGDCAFCGDPENDVSLGARHRTIDAIAERVRAGDHWTAVAEDYGIDAEAVILALAVSW